MNAVQRYPGRGSFANQIERTVSKAHQAVKKGPRITLPPYKRQIPIPVDLAPEIWRSVVGLEGRYEISSKGNLLSLLRSRTKPVKTKLNEKGYERAGLWGNGKAITLFVHRLVASAFIPNPLGLPYVNHLDSNPLNNTWPNLEWTTPVGNSAHALKYGRMSRDKRKPQKSKTLARQIIDAYYNSSIESRPTVRGLSQELGASPATVQRVMSAYRASKGVKMRSIKLNKAIVNDYINRKANGLRTEDIAAKYGITVFSLRQVYARSKKTNLSNSFSNGN